MVAVQPSGPFHGLEGLKHLESAIVPGIYDASVSHVQVTYDTEAAYAMNTKDSVYEKPVLRALKEAVNRGAVCMSESWALVQPTSITNSR
ncbi:hypothetical protein ARMSODRAFT_459885 [Armillaria solidipes]|uniref:Uncharacterized protein n=1 Tax=Armillaria solidipes TaxID=1076256 RepID=A0A2H3B1H4_9AGAR|nr:hypothetical protein ARMSODRAFT_459885 [Armillaria solidipes]